MALYKCFVAVDDDDGDMTDGDMTDGDMTDGDGNVFNELYVNNIVRSTIVYIPMVPLNILTIAKG